MAAWPHANDENWQSPPLAKEPPPALAKVPLCRAATSPVLRDPVVHKNHIEVRGHHSEFAALRHDVLKRFKGASFYKAGRDAVHKSERAGCIAMRYRNWGDLKAI